MAPDEELVKTSPCKVCPALVTNEDPALMCDMCDEWLHIKCAGVTLNHYNELMKKLDGIWFCDMCSAEFKKKKENPSAVGSQTSCENMSEELNLFKSQISKDVSQLNNQIAALASNLNKMNKI